MASSGPLLFTAPEWMIILILPGAPGQGDEYCTPYHGIILGGGITTPESIAITVIIMRMR
jgi:hypothetical protein